MNNPSTEQTRKKKNATLQGRLIAFFAVFASSILICFTLLLVAFGLNGSGKKTVHTYLQNELQHIQTRINDDFGLLELAGVNLATQLNSASTSYAIDSSISLNSIGADSITPLLNRLFPYIRNALSSNICSGAFVMLDATNGCSDSQYAKAGIFLKKTFPTNAPAVNDTIYYLRGPANLARNNGIELLAQWKMEFDTEGQDFFKEVMQNAKDHYRELPLTRLMYWSARVTLKDNSDSGFLMCLPLISNGIVYGVCGMEVNDRLFKQLYSPNDGTFNRTFTVASLISGDTLHSADGLVAGNYYLTGTHICGDLVCSSDKEFNIFSLNDDTKFVGLQTNLKLYPSNSLYEHDIWNVAVMMPKDVFDQASSSNTPWLIAIACALLLLGLAFAYFASKRYLRPVNEALDNIRSGDYSSKQDTYLEINDLMEYLASQDKVLASEVATSAIPPSQTELDAFRSNLNDLTTAEKAVFDLYIQGFKAREIADKLFLSINTIKTHNKRIFHKLNVSSRSQLLALMSADAQQN